MSRNEVAIGSYRHDATSGEALECQSAKSVNRWVTPAPPLHLPRLEIGHRARASERLLRLIENRCSLQIERDVSIAPIRFSQRQRTVSQARAGSARLRQSVAQRAGSAPDVVVAGNRSGSSSLPAKPLQRARSLSNSTNHSSHPRPPSCPFCNSIFHAGAGASIEGGDRLGWNHPPPEARRTCFPPKAGTHQNGIAPCRTEAQPSGDGKIERLHPPSRCL